MSSGLSSDEEAVVGVSMFGSCCENPDCAIFPHTFMRCWNCGSLCRGCKVKQRWKQAAQNNTLDKKKSSWSVREYE